MPATDIPDGLKPVTRSHYENLYDVVADLHAHIDAIEAAIAHCHGFDQECERTRLPEIATLLNGIDDALERIQSCGGNSAEAKLYMLRETEHLRFFGTRRGRMEEALRELLAPGGTAAEQRLKSLREAATVPRPCLEYACPDW